MKTDINRAEALFSAWQAAINASAQDEWESLLAHLKDLTTQANPDQKRIASLTLYNYKEKRIIKVKGLLALFGRVGVVFIFSPEDRISVALITTQDDCPLWVKEWVIMAAQNPDKLSLFGKGLGQRPTFLN